MIGIQLVHALEHLFPDAVSLVDYVIQDNSDGNDPFIDKWNLADSQPTQTQLDQAWIDWQAGADDRLWVEIRAERDQKLRGSDWTHISDTPLTVAKKEEWAIYRQSLRDISKDVPDPNDVIWPVEPEFVEG